MVKILSPTGVLCEIERAVPVCEAVVKINGVRQLFFERAKSLKVNPTGIALKVHADMIEPFDILPSELYIGNLPAEKIGVILSELAKQGYYDFTKQEYQQKEYIFDLAVDKGESLPFSSDITDLVGLPKFFNPLCVNHLIPADLEQDEEEED